MNTLDPIKTKSKGFTTFGVKTLSADELKPAKGIEPASGGQGSNFNASGLVNTGLSALQAAPGIIAQTKVDGADFTSREEIRKAKGSTYMNMISTGAQLGSVAGPWGAAAGAVVGGVGALLTTDGLEAEFNNEQDRITQEEWDAREKERLQNYYDITDSEQMQAHIDLLNKQQGIK